MWKAHHSGPLQREATWVWNLPKEIFTEKHSQQAHHRSPPEREASYRDVKSTSQQSTSKRSHMSVKFAKRDFHGKTFSKSTPQKSTWKRSLIPRCEKHIIAVHFEEKPHECEICKKRYSHVTFSVFSRTFSRIMLCWIGYNESQRPTKSQTTCQIL